MGLTGEELEAGLAEGVHVALGRMPATARTDTGIEGLADTGHVVGGLILADGFAGTVKGFEAPDGKGDSTQGDPKFLIGKLAVFYVLGGAGEQDAEQGFFIFELAADLVIQADADQGGTL
jgi:hypothetical protein